MSNKIDLIFKKSIEVKQECVKQGFRAIEIMGNEIVKSIVSGNKLMLCGNGGSAADAQHLAAELLIRLRPAYNRRGIAAIALAQDTSTITACGNDFGFNVLFQRLVQAIGSNGDVLIAISTSGNSENVILAMQEARKMGIRVYGFLGSGGGKALELCDQVFIVPSNDTGRVQEVHITAGHALMEYVEDELLRCGYLHLDIGN